jgi:DNA-binding NtrC family response regulator
MLTGKKILLADGDEGIRKALSSFFRTRNCHFQAFENGAQALLAMKSTAFDIILCEELLPDMNGLTFFKIVDDNHYEAIKVLLSLYGNSTIFDNFRNRGIDCLLTKPFSGDEIETALHRLIRARHDA